MNPFKKKSLARKKKLYDWEKPDMSHLFAVVNGRVKRLTKVQANAVLGKRYDPRGYLPKTLYAIDENS